MNELQIFNNEEFGQIRTIEIDGKPYFMGSDIAKALGYSRPNDAIKQHCRATVKHRTPISGKMQEVNFVGEGDMYRLITHSKLESAERFESWVFDEVLPTLHKTGSYEVQYHVPQGKELLALAVIEAQKTIEQQTVQIEEMKPKALFADAVVTSKQSILIGELAKLICQNGHSIGQKRLFSWLRDNGYLMKQGSSYNMPMQRYVESGLFEIKESTVTNPDGSVRLTKTTKVTGKGQQYFINKFLNMEVA